ncbi:pseudouridine synthase [Marinomonas foliarum]|jgi:23S rRNA pseudouridine2457 synthase|uniref:Pseudouridine synthase n=1 Tax=Marinomonas foliarum TaxID=491950 RepID=A0A369AH59_9GAMM|nr:pseudouridine synthase [Marinomonas foliarum]RCX08700.1 ribosomal large subunit pseudouridine synthase E [Marinomonas foliarum]
MPSNLILFNKPFRVLSQFSAEGDKATLAKYIDAPDFYPAGRLDFDSEGLLLLTNQGALQHIIASPDFKMPKTYWVQVEGDISDEALEKLRRGVELKDGLTKPAQAERMAEPAIWDRTPPVRYREAIPTSWLSLQIREGKNRQVRRMTAAVGFPTLRLIRYAIGPYTLENTGIGQWNYIEPTDHLLKEVNQFEEQRKRKAASPNRRRPSEKGQQRSQGNKVSHGEGMARRKPSTKPTSRPRRK